MSYTLIEADGDLDADWLGFEVGDTYDECVDKHEVAFLADTGAGPHSVYISNNWYYDEVSKDEFFNDPSADDLKMSFSDWWGEYKD